MKNQLVKCISAYLCIDKDYNRNVQLESNDFSYIKDYYDSIIKTNMKATIIVDNVSNEFIKKYESDNIMFHLVNNKIINRKKMLLHDERFIYFLDIIKNSGPNDYFIVSDVADVIILNNPNDIIDLDENVLYVCKENENIDTNIWFNIYMNELEFLKTEFPDYKEIFNNRIILNCGAVMGHRDIIFKLFNCIVNIMIEIYSLNEIQRPLDMFAFNYIIYKYFSSNIAQNTNFSTKFGHYFFDYTKVVKHK